MGNARTGEDGFASVTGRRLIGIVAAVVAVVLSVVSWGGGRAEAHPLSINDTQVAFDGSGAWEIRMVLDIDARLMFMDADQMLAAGEQRIQDMPAELAEAGFRQTKAWMEQHVQVRFDGTSVPFDVTFARTSPHEWGSWDLALFRGRVPVDAKTFVIESAPFLGSLVMTVRQPGVVEPHRQVVGPGLASEPVALSAPTPAPSIGSVLVRFFVLGFEHIVPEGVDHVLFVLALVLLVPRVRPLLIQITMFTVAHTVTLGLVALEVVGSPPDWIEPLITLSIALVAIENTVGDRLRAWRLWVIFGFGLLHGLGFAGGLLEIGLPTGAVIPGLLACAVGVEIAHLLVAAAALLVLVPLRARPWFRRRVTIPLSAVIAGIALYWVATWLFGG